MAMTALHLLLALLQYSVAFIISSRKYGAVMRSNQYKMYTLSSSPRHTQHSLHSTKFGIEETKRRSLFVSSISIQSDLQLAISDIVSQVSATNDLSKYDTAMFFVSSAYEGAACKYDVIIDTLVKHLPNLVKAVGCTTGAAIGMTNESLPIEVENKASLSVLLLEKSDLITVTVNRYEQVDIERIAAASEPDVISSEKGVKMMFSTDAVKPFLTRFMDTISRGGISNIFGGFASGVSSYHKPKVFLFNKLNHGIIEKFTDGVVALTLEGDIGVSFLVARSCIPVGPMFGITSKKINEVTELSRFDGVSSSDALPPLVQLENVLNEISASEKYGLTRELLLSCVAASPANVSMKGAPQSIVDEEDFFIQKPLSFDPYTGSITVSSLPDIGGTLQFCIRDGAAARIGVSHTQRMLGKMLASPGVSPQLGFLVGSMDRGNKLFRFQSWESLQLFHSMRDNKHDAPVAGFFSNGAFARLSVASRDGFSSSVMETDSLYAVITAGPAPFSAAVEHDSKISFREDVMNEFEMVHFNDRNISVIVEKSQGETSNAVRVAGMDYMVPDKIPQARFVLEQFVWERTKEVDRLRERMSMNRALIQAKLAADRLPRRDLALAVIAFKNNFSIPPVILELHRASVHSGKLLFEPNNLADQMKRLVTVSLRPGVVAIGCQTDLAFSGVYEDLECIKKTCQLPVVCNDFVVFGYQLFRAKASGADAVKLLASVLSLQEITYLIKTAKAIGLDTIVVVASATQLLDVLEHVKNVGMISITSRNHFLWRIDSGKAESILNNPEVRAAVAQWKAKNIQNIIIQEGFADVADFYNTLKLNSVDAVLLGEEILSLCEEGGDDLSFSKALEEWTQVYNILS